MESYFTYSFVSCFFFWMLFCSIHPDDAGHADCSLPLLYGIPFQRCRQCMCCAISCLCILFTSLSLLWVCPTFLDLAEASSPFRNLSWMTSPRPELPMCRVQMWTDHGRPNTNSLICLPLSSQQYTRQQDSGPFHLCGSLSYTMLCFEYTKYPGWRLR